MRGGRGNGMEEGEGRGGNLRMGKGNEGWCVSTKLQSYNIT